MFGSVAFVLCVIAQPAESGLSLEVYDESVRFDLRDGRILESARADGPSRVDELKLATPLALDAVGDEVVAFQVIVRGLPGTYDARMSPLRDAAGVTIAAELFAEHAVVVTTPSLDGYVYSLGAGHYPDILVPTATIAVVAEPAVAVLWVDIWVPPASPPGVFSSTLEVGDAKLPIELTVLDLTLPARDHAALSAVNFGSFLHRQQRDPQVLLRWMQLAHAHHLTVEWLRPTPKVVSSSIAWGPWADMVGPYLDGTAFSKAAGYAGPRADQPVTRYVLPHTDWWPQPEAGDGRPSDPAAFSRALNEWEALAEARGWFKHTNSTEFILFINSLDEPKTDAAFQSLASYGALIADARLRDRTRVKFRVDGAIGVPLKQWPSARVLEDLGPVVDHWNVCGWTAWSPWDLLSKRLERHPDERVFWYASNTAGEPATPPLVVDSPITGARAWGWIVARYGLGGAMNWEVDYKPGCAADPQCTGDGINLDATLMFRGHEVGRGYDEPIASMRLKALRRGAQDVALLAMLRQRDPAAATAIAQTVVPRAMGDDQPKEGRGLWPSRAGAYQRARRAMIDRLTGADTPLAIEQIRVEPASAGGGSLGRTLMIGGGLLLLFAVFRTKRRQQLAKKK